MTDDEGLSATERKYTGQTASCNGAAGARTTRTFTVSATPEPPPPPPDGPIPALEITGIERDRKAGTATLTVAVNPGGALRLAKTNKVKAFGSVELTGAGEAELEVVLRHRAAEKLRRTGRIAVNPQVRFAPTVGGEIAKRRKFESPAPGLRRPGRCCFAREAEALALFVPTRVF